MNQIKKALISVWDKTGIVDIAKFLHSNDVEIVSTGGTKKILEKEGLPVTPVSDITKQNEIMNGRVKTLHPLIFGGVLADRNNKEHLIDLKSLDTSLIDLVIINLYPFKEEAVLKKMVLNKAIEFIDIGGPSLLRAAAKNYQYVIPLSSPNQYNEFIELYKKNNGFILETDRIKYAAHVFTLVNQYDSLIADYFKEKNDLNTDYLDIKYKKKNELRYGENPHQKATFYLANEDASIFNQLHGKDLSYNNYFDIETSIDIVFQFQETACAIIKHANPCGFSIKNNVCDAYKFAVQSDPVSFFGGIVAFNKEVDKYAAEEISKSFLECIVAPSFNKKALEILTKKKNLRLIEIDYDKYVSTNINPKVYKTVFNGLLSQDKDRFIKNEKNFNVVSNRKPNNEELQSLLLGWRIVKFVKSNAIVVNDRSQLIGVGAGQMSRIDSVKIAIAKTQVNGLNLDGATMASDAFFPFPDSIECAKEAGVIGFIQPGGSIKDKDIIKVVNELDLIMILTNERHFYH